jgi:hypothetical protein
MIIGIHQPNFFPWFGYFVKIVRSDTFVFLDDVQLVRNYIYRTSLNINGNPQFFSVPIKRESQKQLISQSYFANILWRRKLKGTLRANYSKAPYYQETIDFTQNLIDYNTDSLSEFNIHNIIALSEYLGIENTFINSSSLLVPDSSTKRLVEIIKKLNGDTYLSGMGGDKYQLGALFEKNKIRLLYNEFEHPVYNQNNTKTFLPGLSILDILFNIGREKVHKYLLSLKL